jgi:hypothetical protein
LLNGTNIDDFAEGDYIELNPLNPLTERLNGSNDSLTVTDRIDSNVYDVVFRVVRYSDSDVVLNGFLNAKVFIDGSLKEDYVKDGNDNQENWTLEGGTFTIQPSHRKNNQTGDQLVEYTIQFRNTKRTI